jgi:tRNA (mo5U34)-methyltransferase
MEKRMLTGDFSKPELEAMANSVPLWFHSIHLGQGVVTKGFCSANELEHKIELLGLPDLKGKTVLDINAWDGFFSFEAERRGASRVVALDQYMWAMEPLEHYEYWKTYKEQKLTPQPYHTMPYYKPDLLPGKAGFDTAHKALGSNVEVAVGDFMKMDLSQLGTFDICFYLGSLYHMEDPLRALRRLFSVTRELAIIETEAAEFPPFREVALCEFFESNELNGDVSNWWAPNERALQGMCRAAGFSRVDIIVGSPMKEKPSSFRAKLRHTSVETLREFAVIRPKENDGVIRYRLVARASKLGSP